MSGGASGQPASDRRGAYRLPLFERFPALEGRLPRAPLGDFPTPVRRLARLDHDDLWIKRDDLSSPLYGGNKARKLEFVLGDALARRRTGVRTMGGLGTNHGVATAVFCRALGLDCAVLLYRQPLSDSVRRNMLLMSAAGARLRFSGGALRTGVALLGPERFLHPRSRILGPGGSCPLGTVGFVNAAFELKAQVDAGELPEPRWIFCPLGTCGTAAGLSLGVALAGLSSTVVGVRVVKERTGPVAVATPGAVERLERATLALLRRHCPDVPDAAVRPPVIMGDYLGEGYGFPTPESRAALVLAGDREGIELDPVYTAKAFAALLDFLPAHRRETILFWHTHNSADLSPLLANADPRILPPALRKIYEAGEEGNHPSTRG